MRVWPYRHVVQRRRHARGGARVAPAAHRLAGAAAAAAQQPGQHGGDDVPRIQPCSAAHAGPPLWSPAATARRCGQRSKAHRRRVRQRLLTNKDFNKDAHQMLGALLWQKRTGSLFGTLSGACCAGAWALAQPILPTVGRCLAGCCAMCAPRRLLAALLCAVVSPVSYRLAQIPRLGPDCPWNTMSEPPV